MTIRELQNLVTEAQDIMFLAEDNGTYIGWSLWQQPYSIRYADRPIKEIDIDYECKCLRIVLGEEE